MEIKNFNKTIIPTEKELEELIEIYNLIYSKDEESIKLGQSLYKYSLYFKRVKNCRCTFSYYHEISSKIAYHKVSLFVKKFTDDFFIVVILSICEKNNSFLENYFIKKNNKPYIPYNKLIII